MVQDKEQVTQNATELVPGVGSSYTNGWRQLRRYFLKLFLIGILGAIIGILSEIGGWTGGGVAAAIILGIIGFAYSILIAGPLEYGVSFAHLKAVRGDKLVIKDMFEAFRNYRNAVLANVLVGVIVVIGTVLLIIPGIIFGCKLAFTPYLVVDRKMRVIEAVRNSWRMTNGHAWKVFLITLLAIPISIAGLIVFGVGIIVSIMWIRLAMASLYQSVSLSDKVSD